MPYSQLSTSTQLSYTTDCRCHLPATLHLRVRGDRCLQSTSTTITARAAPTYVLASSVHSRARRIFANGWSLRPCAASVLVHASVAHPTMQTARRPLSHISDSTQPTHSHAGSLPAHAIRSMQSTHEEDTFVFPRPRRHVVVNVAAAAHTYNAHAVRLRTPRLVSGRQQRPWLRTLRYVGNTSPDTHDHSVRSHHPLWTTACIAWQHPRWTVDQRHVIRYDDAR